MTCFVFDWRAPDIGGVPRLIVAIPERRANEKENMMFKRTMSAALVFGAVATAPPAALAQSNCAPRDILVERLKERYAETLKGGGLQNANVMLEVWSSDSTGSFTVLMSRADGISCVVASGQDWTSVVAVTGADDTPS